MKSHYFFTGIMALTTLVVMSCSAPRMAQQNTNDDVYNSVAQAKEYSQQVPIRQQAPVTESEQYQTEDDYGTSDPYYDMDYSSRINRFSYANPGWRSYYDPYFDGGWYGNYGMSLGFGLGFGFSPFYGSLWNSPYSRWGNYYSPFWGYNNFLGGGYYGGGYYGGGYYGGGFYTGRTTPVDYNARPRRGGSGYGPRGTESLSPRSSRGQGNVVSGRPSRGMDNGSGTVNSGMTRPSRTGNTNPTTQSPRPATGSRPTRSEARPTRTESRPTRTESRPARESYTPRPSYTPSRSSEGRSSGGGSYGGGGSSRPARGGR